MSQYAEFFIRKGENDYTFLNSFSRNSDVQQALDEAGFLRWEKLVHLDREDFRQLSKSMQDKIEVMNDEIKKMREKIDLITKMNNDINDKLERINENMAAIEEMEDDKRSYQFTMNFFDILGNMANTFSYSEKNQKIYVGLEVGTHPTDNDIA